MDDFFGDDPVQQSTAQAEVDPAAEFLAQQENEIAGLESETLGGVTDEQTPVENGFDDFTGAEPPLQQTQEAVLTNGGDDLFSMPADYDMNQTNDASGDMGFGGDGEVETMDPSQAYAAIARADERISELKAEPEKIRIWRENHNNMLEDKDREEEEKKEEMLAAARKELEDWERNRQEQLEKTKANNRIANAAFLEQQQKEHNIGSSTEAENNFIQDRDEQRPGSEWGKVAKLCDFNPKSSKGTKDVSRMRSTMLQLKQHNLSKKVEIGQ